MKGRKPGAGEEVLLEMPLRRVEREPGAHVVALPGDLHPAQGLEGEPELPALVVVAMDQDHRQHGVHGLSLAYSMRRMVKTVLLQPPPPAPGTTSVPIGSRTASVAWAPSKSTE